MLNPSQAASHIGGAVFQQSQLSNFPQNNFTVSFWTKQPVRLFFAEYDTGSSFNDTDSNFFIDVQSGLATVSFSNNSADFPTGSLTFSGPNDVHHIAVTIAETPTGYTVACYVNAVLIKSTPLTLMNGNNEVMRVAQYGPLYIGNQAPNPGLDGRYNGIESSRGALSELHIYSETLTSDMVNQDALGNIPVDSSLYLNLPLDAGHYNRKLRKWQDLVNDDFSAIDYVRTDDSPELPFFGDYTKFPTGTRSVAFWIRSHSDQGTLISYGNVSNSDHPNDGGSVWELSDPTGLRLGNISSEISVADGTWNHIAIVEDAEASTTTFYLNGEVGPRGTIAQYTSGVITSQPMVLGAQYTTDNGDDIFTGDITALRIWSRALTATEISLFASGRVPTVSDDTLTDFIALGIIENEDSNDFSDGKFPPFSVVDEPTYPLLSSLSISKALQVTSNKGGMVTTADLTVVNNQLSIEMWAKITADGYMFFVGNADNPDAAALVVESKKFTVLVAKGNQGVSTAYTYQVDDDVDLSLWHHYAIVISSSNVYLYIDGVDVLNGQVIEQENLPDLTKTLTLQVGGVQHGPTPTASATITEVRFWDRALVVGEVRHRMHHSIKRSVPGLIGRWGFENGLGRDSTGNGHHLHPVGKPEFELLAELDLSPLDTPYLVAQVTLMQDYHFSEDETQAPTERNSYRVNIVAYDKDDKPLPQIPLSVKIQPEPNSVTTQADILSESHGHTTAHPIDVNTAVELITNQTGSVSFSMAANDLLAPVLRVTAPFMAKDHALLVFPDRQAHHALASITEDTLNSKPVVCEPGQPARALIKPEYAESTSHVASAIRRFISPATEKAPQSHQPVVRPITSRLKQRVVPPQTRPYESATASPDAYNPHNDVISGYAVDPTQTHISRSITTEHIVDWEMVVKDDNKNFVVQDVGSNNNARSVMDASNIEAQDDLTKILLSLQPGRGRSDAPSDITYDSLLNAIDHSHHGRGFFSSLREAIADAIHVVVSTIKATFDAVKDAVEVAMLYIKDTAGKVLAFAIHTIEHAIDAVVGVLEKVGATVTGAINLIKQLFEWDDIRETQNVIEAMLRQLVEASKRKAQKKRDSILTDLHQIKGHIHDKLETYKSNPDHKKALKTANHSGSRSNVKSGYVQHLANSHAQSATLEGDEDTNSFGSGEDLSGISNDPSNSAILTSNANSAQLINSSDYSMESLMDGLIELMQTITDAAFNAIENGVTWFFDKLETLLDTIHAVLDHRINIPLVTRLYEQVIMRGTSKLSLYSLAALLGAIPATITYKALTNSKHGPMRESEKAQYEAIINSIDANDHSAPPVPAPMPSPSTRSVQTAEALALSGRLSNIQVRESDEGKPEITDEQKASYALGWVFFSVTIVAGIANTVKAGGAIPSTKWKRVTFAINAIFQLSQFPLGSSLLLSKGASEIGDAAVASNTLEETIWVAQFFPIVLEGIEVHGNNLPTNPRFVTLNSVGITVFGAIHAALFLVVFIVEITDDNKDHMGKIDSGLKLVGNIASCVPEICEAPIQSPPLKQLLTGASFLVWDGFTLARLIIEGKYGGMFSPR